MLGGNQAFPRVWGLPGHGHILCHPALEVGHQVLGRAVEPAGGLGPEERRSKAERRPVCLRRPFSNVVGAIEQPPHPGPRMLPTDTASRPRCGPGPQRLTSLSTDQSLHPPPSGASVCRAKFAGGHRAETCPDARVLVVPGECSRGRTGPSRPLHRPGSAPHTPWWGSTRAQSSLDPMRNLVAVLTESPLQSVCPAPRWHFRRTDKMAHGIETAFTKTLCLGPQEHRPTRPAACPRGPV